MWTLETQTDGVLEVRYSLAGLASRTTYEVHVHEFGAVGVPDGSGVGRVGLRDKQQSKCWTILWRRSRRRRPRQPCRRRGRTQIK